MANIKDLFEKGQGNKLIANSSLGEVGDPIESADYVKSKVAQIKQVIPNVDFTTASNFSFYGLAEEYYKTSIDYITNEYPYDGSDREKINWELTGTYLDKYFFDNLYPRTNGYVNIGEDYGTVTQSGISNLDNSSKTEYIKFFGGPHASPLSGTQTLASQFSEANIYATGSRQESNIEVDGNTGFSVEFWFKKGAWIFQESREQIVLDLWNSGSGPYHAIGANVGLFRVSTQIVDVHGFKVNITSGSVENAFTMGTNLPITSGSWNHYALTFKNSGSNLVGKLYHNSTLVDTNKTLASIDRITGSMVGYIGATSGFGDGGIDHAPVITEGFGKLSGSLDDFRIWKTARTEKDIQENWFTSINGGTNTDYELAVSSSKKYDFSNNADLGIYYKFNEGIIDTSSIDSQDAVVLDYAGRSSNGTWTGYSVGARNTGSAMVLSDAAASEFKDPIIYLANPLVSDLRTTYIDQGKLYDAENNSALYWSLPSWITNEDQSKTNSPLRNLTQIMGSQFDQLQLQMGALKDIKSRSYDTVISGSKPQPFMSEILRSFGMDNDEILSNATALEYLASRNETENFEAKLSDTKNLIYLNIYNNLVDIYKSKGTEKAFRNLIRCFGIDESIVNLNLYGSNIDYQLRENEGYSVVRKKAIDFFDPDRFGATVYQHTSSLNANTRAYIDFTNLSGNVGSTFECEAFFKPNPPRRIDGAFSVDFLTSSVFGSHTSGSSEGWGSPDYGSFQVTAIRKNLRRKEAYFSLASISEDGLNVYLTSSTFKGVYDNSKWNLSVRVYPEDTFVGSVSGSTTTDYVVRFTGFQYVLDDLVNSFDVSSSINSVSGLRFLQSKKKMFTGAHRTNFNGTLLQKTNAQISNLKVWAKKVENEQLQVHAKDLFNYGVKEPGNNQFISLDGIVLGHNQIDIPDIKTLALNWDFETVTGSDASGNIIVPDFSSGSSSPTDYAFLNDITQYQHSGYGYGFPVNSTNIVERKYVNSSIQKKPELINSANMVSIISETDDELYTRSSRPIDYYFSFEKSMYNVISKDMLNMFATIINFNNIMGEPVYRYRQGYKNLEKLRQLYFQNVTNDPDFEKFLEYYKWIDSSISVMLMQLAPASANFLDGMKNMIESHVLERNKYWSKFPTIDQKGSTNYNVAVTNVATENSEYSESGDWFPSAPKVWPTSDTKAVIPVEDKKSEVRGREEKSKENPDLKLKELAKVAGTEKPSSLMEDPVERKKEVTEHRASPEKIAKVKGTVSDSPLIYKGGSNVGSNQKHVDYAKGKLNVGDDITLSVESSKVDLYKFKDQRQKILEKGMVKFPLKDSSNPQGYNTLKGELASPFSLYSSSADTGYIQQVRNNFVPTDETFPSGVTASINITNYHDDSYHQGGIPIQGPFTQEHVGGRQARHQGIVTTPQTDGDLRGESWNLDITGNAIQLTPRSYSQARATRFREGTAKKPVNIRNIKYNTGSQTIGNYSEDYEILQTSGRTINNRYFIETEGATLTNASSSYVKNLFEYEMPRYDLTGTNKSIFVERFSAPGGPETTAGGLNVFGAEYSVYNTLNYRNLTVRRALDGWYSEYTGRFGIKSGSSVSADGYNTNAAYDKTNRNPRHVVTQESTCSVIYDNWWVQHAIPQSVFQYAWVTASVSKSECNTFGYVTPFTIPSGTTSTTQSEVPFITASSVVASDIEVDFVGLNTLINDPINTSNNLLSSSTGIYRNTIMATIPAGDMANSLLTHRNGPYQYPSWKQSRTGETPIARYHKKNNILSVSPAPSVITLPDGNGPGQVAQYLDRRPSTFENFVEPPVSFKNKSLESIVGDNEGNRTTIVHPYGNKKQYFSQPIGNSGSITDYIGFIEPNTQEMYDQIIDANNITLVQNKYGEIIYPRDALTGLAKTRTRTDYAETATVTDGSASFSTGSNGIDRGPLLRRTMWRDQADLRNRRIFFEGTEYTPYGTTFTSCVEPDIATTLPNSQGFLDAAATSIYALGRTPLTFCDTNFVTSSGEVVYAPQSLYPPPNPNSPELSPPWGGTDPTSDFLSGTQHMISLFPDTGELNSANWQTIAGYIGISSGSSVGGSWAHQTTFHPTASVYYYHRSKTMGNAQVVSLNKLAWNTSELAGKNPWFDSYEDYSQDISKIAPNFTIIPEFRISEHMDYYSEFNFRKNNDKFLTLNGASITSSALIESSGESRGFNESFFNDYSNTDFQNYFGEFSSDLDLGRISLTCNGVKKLLPYNGFYPSHRTLQLATLFSQSIAPHIGGIGWKDGTFTSSSTTNSGALAVQSLLQPYFAPGILYNTIKSGIATDWAAYTGSDDSQGLDDQPTYGYALANPSNYRIPFESLLDPLSDIGIPVSSSSGKNKLQLLYPTYVNPLQVVNGKNQTDSRAFDTARRPFVDMTDQGRSIATAAGDYNLYRLGINNFLAEIPQFFLEEQKLKSISSKRQDEISLVSGTAYYIDLLLAKDSNVVMIDDYLNEVNNGQPLSISQFRTYNGQFFGPPTLGGSGYGDLIGTCVSGTTTTFYNTLPEYGYLQYSENAGDPLYAPYTPPYFYGKATATIKYVADEEDEKGNFNYKKMFEKSSVTYSNAELYDNFTRMQKRSDYINWVTSSTDGSFECYGSPTGEYYVLSRSLGAPLWDFGASSQLSRSVGVGQFLEWKALGGSKNRMVGLNNDPPAASTYTDMEYAIHMYDDDALAIWENGLKVYDNYSSGSFSPGDWFRVLIEDDGTVKYQKSSTGVNTNYPNGNPRVGEPDSSGSMLTAFKYAQPGSYETIFTSNTASSHYSTLYPDVSIQDVDGAIAYAQVSTIRQTYPAEEGAMQLSASINTFGILTEKQSRFDDKGNLLEVVDAPDESRNRWIISPKMETPVLDFSNQPRVEQFGRGMWSGYGQLLTSSNGVTFGIEETFKEGYNAGSASLLQKCFETPQIRKVGEVADVKKISEAIIAIPYSPSAYARSSKYAQTTPVLDRNFFRIKTRTYDFYKKWYEQNKEDNLFNIPTDNDGNAKPSESITKMLSLMDNYVIPPELDFMTYEKGRSKINPFAMYIFEFNHYLDAQDLADIWQGIMPRISTNPEMSDPSIDDNTFSHPTGNDEFFHGKQMPPDTRWMVFKVKKRASYNYFDITPTNSDDEQFNLAFSLGKKKLPYSYNWPYDFFSLVELAQIETENTFVLPGSEISEDDT